MKLKELEAKCDRTPYQNSFVIDEIAKKLVRALKEDMRNVGTATYVVTLERK